MRKLRVLIQNRSAAHIVPGGDSVVVAHLFEQLSLAGVHVDSVAGPRDPRDYDIVHIINLTTGEEARQFADACNDASRPYVLTALYEDWPRYLNNSLATIPLFRNYLASGRSNEQFQSNSARLMTGGGPKVGNDRVLHGAAAVFACAPSECDRIVRDYDVNPDRVHIVHFGADSIATPSPESIARIKEQIGPEPFALCCGRLETRKNQLMLMKALEGENFPIVLAIGTASVQEPYIELARQMAVGQPVHFVRRLENDDFAALISAASVHVLPSWFELPGLVTLEAAALGTPVVASTWGAIADYLPAKLFHPCEPDSPESIASAVRSALRAAPNHNLRAKAFSYKWSDFADQTLAVYEKVLGASRTLRQRKLNDSNCEFEDIHETETNMNHNGSHTYRYDASIIIPCYNRAELTRECFEAICRDTPHCTYEVICVDNGSADDTPEILKAIEGDFKTIRFSSNQGFAIACNEGAKIASGEYLVFLNNDTRPESGWLDALVEAARNDEKVGIVGALLTYPDGRVQHAGIAVSEKKVPYHVLQNFAVEHPAVQEQRTMTAVTGACMLVSNTLFRELHGFNEEYQNGFEDIDLCLRVAKSGYKCRYTPSSRVMHHEESSPGRKDHDRQNYDLFMSKWAGELVADENELLNRFGLQIKWSERGGAYSSIAETVTTEEAPSIAAPTLERAQQLYVQGDFRSAAEVLQAVVEKQMSLGSEDGFEAWQTLGNCLTRLNETAKAEDAYYQAIRLNDTSERPYLGLGTLAMLSENWLAAQYSFMTALAKNPSVLKGEFGAGISLAARNRHADAVVRFRRVVENEPENAEALFYFYRSAMEGNDPEAAIPSLEAFVNRHPDDTNFLFNLCGAYWKAGQLTQAINTCRQVLEREPEHTAALEIMGHFETALPANA